MPTRLPTMGADVEIVELFSEDSANVPVIKPKRVRVNGVDVGLIAKDGLRVDPGDGLTRVATVSLTLQVHSITICAEDVEGLS